MLGFIKELVAPKAGLKLIIRVTLNHDASFRLVDTLRAFNVLGWMQFAQGYILIELEGPRSKLEAVVAKIQQTRISTNPLVTEVNWVPYKNQFRTFRVAT